MDLGSRASAQLCSAINKKKHGSLRDSSAIDDFRSLGGGSHGAEVGAGMKEGTIGWGLQESPHLEFPLEAG